QPCPKHHRLKHRTGWTPTPAGKNHPPGWTSPSQRHYPGEHQDWEPPRWPHHLPITDTGTDPDPFPDWSSFTAAHPWPDPDPDDMDDPGEPDWPATLNDPFPECDAFQSARSR
ncbi:hypothetical protein AB0323_23030, partial [Arthrobacter sp. NPDC080031]